MKERKVEEAIFCHMCNKQLDFLTSSASEDIKESFYICMASIKQKIFVYGRYIGGKYGAKSYKRYYTKDECSRKICENDIRNLLDSLQEKEYSRLINCERGNMSAVILTEELVERRLRDHVDGKLKHIFPEYSDKRKYYCYEDAMKSDYKCRCGEDLIQIGSERYRDLIGMEDHRFVEKYLPDLFDLK